MDNFGYDDEPEEYKIVETIYDVDEEEDHRQRLNDDLASLDKMDIYDSHIIRDTGGNIYLGKQNRRGGSIPILKNSTKHKRYSS